MIWQVIWARPAVSLFSGQVLGIGPESSMAQPLDANYVVERSYQQLVKLAFLAFILALALTRNPSADQTHPMQ